MTNQHPVTGAALRFSYRNILMVHLRQRQEQITSETSYLAVHKPHNKVNVVQIQKQNTKF